jgi:hypothetical protein
MGAQDQKSQATQNLQNVENLVFSEVIEIYCRLSISVQLWNSYERRLRLSSRGMVVYET